MATNLNDGSPSSGSTDNQADDSGLSDEYTSLFQLVASRAREAAGAVVSAVRGQPLVAVGIVAVGLGVLIGNRLAGRRRRPLKRLGEAVEDRATAARKQVTQAAKSSKKVRRAADYAEIARLGMDLAQNPIIRALVIRAATRGIARRFR